MENYLKYHYTVASTGVVARWPGYFGELPPEEHVISPEDLRSGPLLL